MRLLSKYSSPYLVTKKKPIDFLGQNYFTFFSCLLLLFPLANTEHTTTMVNLLILRYYPVYILSLWVGLCVCVVICVVCVSLLKWKASLFFYFLHNGPHSPEEPVTDQRQLGKWVRKRRRRIIFQGAAWNSSRWLTLFLLLLQNDGGTHHLPAKRLSFEAERRRRRRRRHWLMADTAEGSFFPVHQLGWFCFFLLFFCFSSTLRAK